MDKFLFVVIVLGLVIGIPLLLGLGIGLAAWIMQFAPELFTAGGIVYGLLTIFLVVTVLLILRRVMGGNDDGGGGSSPYGDLPPAPREFSPRDIREITHALNRRERTK